MRFLPLFSLISLATFTIGLPVPEACISDSLQDRDLTLIDGRAIQSVEYDERAVQADYGVEDRSLSPPPLDLDTRSEGDMVRQASLFRKDAGNHLEPRLVGAIVQGAQALAEAVMSIVKHVKGLMRNTWTQWLIAEVRKKIGKNWNALVIHPKHDYKFSGVKGKDWYHKHFEFKNSVIKGTTTGYDLYWFKEGEVTSKGDGGFLNWCYEGIIKSKQLLGKKTTVVKFGRPS